MRTPGTSLEVVKCDGFCQFGVSFCRIGVRRMAITGLMTSGWGSYGFPPEIGMVCIRR